MPWCPEETEMDMRCCVSGRGPYAGLNWGTWSWRRLLQLFLQWTEEHLPILKPTMLIFTKEGCTTVPCMIIATSAHLPTAHPGLKKINHMDFSAYLRNRPRHPCSPNHMIWKANANGIVPRPFCVVRLCWFHQLHCQHHGPHLKYSSRFTLYLSGSIKGFF